MKETRFKDTEIGRIPEEWEVKTIDSIGLLKAGKSTTFIEEDKIYPCYGGNGIREYVSYFSYDGVFPIIGRQGALCGNLQLAVGKFHATEHAVVVSVNKDIDPYWAYYALDYANLNQYATGCAQPGLAVKDLNLIKIPKPTKEELSKIGSALTSIDNLISSLDKLIEKKKNIKQATMQQLLSGAKRLGGYTGDWRSFRLSDCASIKARIGWQGLTTDEYLDSGRYYLITGSDFNGGTIAWNNCHFVSEERYMQDKNIQIRENDVLVSKDGTIGKVAYLRDIPGEGTLNSGVFVIRSKTDAVSQDYLALVFLSSFFDDFISKIVAGSTIVHLYQKDIVNFTFLVPPTVQEQKSIAHLLTTIGDEIHSLAEKKAKYESIKQGMMQQLLTGKIRLI